LEERINEKRSLNLAIVGGGRTCRFFLNLIKLEAFPFFNIKIVGVCDINPEAEGILMAREMGIYTTDNFKELFNIRELDGIIELTNNREVLLELFRLRPSRVGIIEHNISHLLRKYFSTDQKLKSAEHQVIMEKMISDFLIQQAKHRIVVLKTDFTISEANEPYLKSVGTLAGYASP
jgi:hypothetical protein